MAKNLPTLVTVQQYESFMLVDAKLHDQIAITFDMDTEVEYDAEYPVVRVVKDYEAGKWHVGLEGVSESVPLAADDRFIVRPNAKTIVNQAWWLTKDGIYKDRFIQIVFKPMERCTITLPMRSVIGKTPVDSVLVADIRLVDDEYVVDSFRPGYWLHYLQWLHDEQEREREAQKRLQEQMDAAFTLVDDSVLWGEFQERFNHVG